MDPAGRAAIAAKAESGPAGRWRGPAGRWRGPAKKKSPRMNANEREYCFLIRESGGRAQAGGYCRESGERGGHGGAAGPVGRWWWAQAGRRWGPAGGRRRAPAGRLLPRKRRAARRGGGEPWRGGYCRESGGRARRGGGGGPRRGGGRAAGGGRRWGTAGAGPGGRRRQAAGRWMAAGGPGEEKKSAKKRSGCIEAAYAALRGFGGPDKGFATAYMPKHRTKGTRPGPTKCGGGLEAAYAANQQPRPKGTRYVVLIRY
jgi:hypothetical protein